MGLDRRLARELAPEARGHGHSERRPRDVSPEAFVLDAELWLERLTSAPAFVVGQSLGGITALWTGIRCPALVVRAALGAPREQAERMAELLPGTRLAEIADAGHDLHLDQPERWRDVVLEFIDAVG